MARRTRLIFRGLRRGQIFLRFRAEGLQLLDLRKEIAAAGFHLGDGFVVERARARELHADLFEVGVKAGEFVVEQAAAAGDFLDVARLALLFPDGGDRLQRREQHRRRDDDHAAVERPFVDRAVGFECERERRIDRDEHEHVVGREELAGVGVLFPGELFDVAAHGGDVGLAREFLRGGVEAVDDLLVVDERDFRIDHEVPLVGEAQDDVGADAAAAVGADERFLDEIIFARAEAGAFEEPVEDDLAPRAARLGLAFQGLRERVRFVGDAGVELAELLDLGLERGAVVAFGLVDGVDARAKIGELLAKRREERVDLRLVVLGELGGLFVEEFRGGGFEFGFEARADFLDVGEILGGAGFLFREALLLGGETGFGIGAGAGEIGGQLGGLAGELGVEGGDALELGGEAGVFVGAGAEAFVQRRGA